MNINDGKGLYDKYGLIDSIMVQVNSLVTQGVRNASTICDICNKLDALKRGLQEDDKRAEANNQEAVDDGGSI